MIKAVLFDLGDTLFNPDWTSIDKAMLKEVGISIFMSSDIKNIYNREVLIGKKSMVDVFKIMIKEHNKDLNLNDIIKAYKRNYQKYSPINRKIISLIGKLKRVVKLYALSNTNEIHKEVNKKRGIFKHFNKIFLSCEMGIKKPNKQIFLYILNEININPKEIIFIDNDNENIRVANQFGIISLKYRGYDKLIEDLKELNLY